MLVIAPHFKIVVQQKGFHYTFTEPVEQTLRGMLNLGWHNGQKRYQDPENRYHCKFKPELRVHN